MTREVWQLNALGAPLQRTQHPVPEPGPGQVVLRMSAMSLNYRDLLMVGGQYDPRVPLPLVPGSDGVGVVEARGDGVDLPIGARRMPLFATGWKSGPPRAEHLRTTLGGPNWGTLQTHFVVDADATVAAPAHLSDEEAATLPCAGVTAWHALELAAIGAGSTVLTLGTGGVSLFALQLAKARGARVAITSSSDERLERCRALGADFTLNYRTQPSWGKAVAAWSGGVDGVIEVGGAGTLDQSLRATRVGGCIALIGVLAGGSGEVALVNALMRSIRLQGVFVGSGTHARALAAAMTDHAIHPQIAGTFGWTDAPAAFEALRSGGQFGKVVVRIP